MFRNPHFKEPIPISRKPDLATMEYKGFISTTEKQFLNRLAISLKMKITRQVIFDNKIQVDGVIADQKVKFVIQFDGPQNHKSPEKQSKDSRQDLKLLQSGYSIYRFQWFEWVDFKEWSREIQNAVDDATPIILDMIKIQNNK